MTDQLLSDGPKEIPWKLAANVFVDRTGRPLPASSSISPSGSIAVLWYAPSAPSLATDYPGSRILYFKVIASISPKALRDYSAPVDESGFGWFWWHPTDDGMPAWTAIINLQLRSASKAKPTTPAPYFISAAPVRREMVETGVIGASVLEGESNSIAVGRSATALQKGSKTIGTTIPLPQVWGTPAPTTATGTGERTSLQVVDTTSRDASVERRELFTHTTSVTNITSLLVAKHLGTPYLRFEMRPRPIASLAVDPNDPNLWYAELLRRRSRGIEGIQEFYAVAVVPDGLQQFCLDVSVTTAHIFDPGVKGFDLDILNAYSYSTVERYLSNRYPPGTSLDDMDVLPRPFGGQPDWASDQQAQPIIHHWWVEDPSLGSSKAFCVVQWLDANGNSKGAYSTYKLYDQVRLEAYIAERRSQTLLSPLQRGVLTLMRMGVSTCFSDSGGHGKFGVLSASVDAHTEPRLPQVAFTVPAMELGGGEAAVARRAALTWDDLDNQLFGQLAFQDFDTAPKFRFDNPRVVDLVVRTLASTPSSLGGGLSLSEAAKLLGLSSAVVQTCKRLGIAQLNELAGALRASHLEGAALPPSSAPDTFAGALPPPQIAARLQRKPTFTPAQATNIQRAIGASLHRSFEPWPNTPA